MTPLGLTLYHLTARPSLAARVWPDRPQGRLIWLHLAHSEDAAAAHVLAQRLIVEGGFLVLITHGNGAGLSGDVLQDVPPEDTPKHVSEFLAHYAPCAIVLIGATLRPSLILGAKQAGIPTLLVQARAPELIRGSDRLFLGLMRHLVAALDVVMTVDGMAARTYRRLGSMNVLRIGYLDAAQPPLPHNEPERAAMAAMLATRPVWLAVDVPNVEIPALIAAHRRVMRLSHRLLLILMPQDAAIAPSLAEQLEKDEGWIVARRDLDEEPDQATSVYIADAGQEYGLWYRLSPITYMGGSLLGQGSQRHPFEAAALGSAIIHGRKIGSFGHEFGLLGAALGAAAVSNGDELADVVTDLLAPDRAARMAHAAWGVMSEGAEVMNRIVATTLHFAQRTN